MCLIYLIYNSYKALIKKSHLSYLYHLPQLFHLLHLS